MPALPSILLPVSPLTGEMPKRYAVRNNTATALAGGQFVYITGWNEVNKIYNVALAGANVANGAAEYFIPESIGATSNGYAVDEHRLDGVDTSAGALGDPVYLSTTAGTWTLTAPTGTSIVQKIGRIAVAGTNGSIQLDMSAQYASELSGQAFIVNGNSSVAVSAPNSTVVLATGGSTRWTWAAASANVTLAAAADIIGAANVASMLRITDGTTALLSVDSRNTVTGVATLTITPPAAISIVSAAGTTYSAVSLPANTVTLTGGVLVTAMAGLALNIASPTVTSAAATTVTTASALIVNGPLPAGAGGVTFTNSVAIDVPTYATNGTTASGVRIAAPTGAGTNWALNVTSGGITVAGASTVAGLLTASAGVTVSGATSSINASSNFATNINTGTSTGAVSIGNSLAGALALASGAASTVTITGANLTVTQNVLAVVGNVVAGGASALTVTPGAHTAVLAETIDVSLVAHTMTITGNYATQRSVVLASPTVTSVGVQTITTMVTAQVNGPLPAGAAVFTNSVALDLPTFVTNGTTASGVRIAAPTGATNNFALNVTSGVTQLPDGTAAAPTLRVTTSNTGFYRETTAPGTDGLGLSIAGTRYFSFQTDGGPAVFLDARPAATRDFTIRTTGNTTGRTVIIGSDGGAGSVHIRMNTSGAAGTGVIDFANGADTGLASMSANGTLTMTPIAVAAGVSSLVLTPGAHTAVIAEVLDINIAAHTMTITGNYATQRSVVLASPTVTSVGAQTITTMVTMQVNGPLPAGAAVFTNSVALDLPTYVTNGTTASGIRIAAPTGGGTNYAINVTAGLSVFQTVTMQASPLNVTAAAAFAFGTTDANTVSVKTTNTNRWTWAAASSNVTLAGAADIAGAANTASMIRLTDGTTAILALDSRNTVSAVNAVAITPSAPTIVSAAGTTYAALNTLAYTVTLTGGVLVTAMAGLSLTIGSPTVTSGAATTVTTASAVIINGPLPAGAGPVTFTNSFALDIPTFATNGTTAAALRLALPSGATNNMALDVPGAGVGIWLEGSRLQIGGAVATTANQFHTASQGAATTTMWIGNASINVTSDVRVKRDIVPTTLNAIDLFNMLHVVDYTWDDPSDQAENNRNSRGRFTGMIAQDMVDVVPWIINAPDRLCPTCRAGEQCASHPNHWFVEYPHLTGLIVKGFQELDARVTRLEAALASRR